MPVAFAVEHFGDRAVGEQLAAGFDRLPIVERLAGVLHFGIGAADQRDQPDRLHRPLPGKLRQMDVMAFVEREREQRADQCIALGEQVEAFAAPGFDFGAGDIVLIGLQEIFNAHRTQAASASTNSG